MPKNAIIVGLPRSGTSMTAAIFAGKGYFTAANAEQELRAGDHHNPSGYLEAETLIKFNADVFAAVDFPHDNTWLYDPLPANKASKIHRVFPIAEHADFINCYNHNSPWMWKDPRLCYTLDYWWPMIGSEDTRVLLIKRNPEEVYQSFIRLKWRKKSSLSKRDVYARVEDHMAAAEKAIARHNIPHVTIEYGDYAAKPAEVAQRIGEFFDIALCSADLSYSGQLNHSSMRGKLATVIDLQLERLPSHWVKTIKSVVPGWLMRAVYPERFK